MESGCSNVGTTKTKKTTGTDTHRTWKPTEEAVLTEFLKELVAAGGWKSENGFRHGYCQRLEDMLREKIPRTDIRANPHILSGVTIWKRHHVALQSALEGTDGEFNTKTKVLDISDTSWDKAVKEPTISSMRYRPWPFYNDWFEVFGNDGANGGSSQTVIDAVNDIVYEDANVDATGIPPIARKCSSTHCWTVSSYFPATYQQVDCTVPYWE